jgi:hypothetical protein
MLKTSLTAFLVVCLASAPTWAQNVTIQVDTTPSQSLIVVDRQIKGQGRASLELSPGPHLLRVSAGDAWETYQTNLDVSTAQSLHIHLKPSSERRVMQARHDMQAKNFDSARGLLLIARANSPVTANYWLGYCEWSSDHPRAALTAFRAYAHYVPDWPELYLFLGDLQERTGHPYDAFTAYKAALIKRKGMSDALDGVTAPTDAEIAQLGKPTDVRDQLRLSQMLMLKGQIHPALHWVSQAIAQVYGDWRNRDWLSLEPKLIPEPASEQPAPPEDTVRP